MSESRRADAAEQPIVQDTWREKYRYGNEPDWDATCARVVAALCKNESTEFGDEAQRAMRARQIVPAGRILAGAGTDKHVTLINCFVSPDIQDSMRTHGDRPGAGIMDALSQAAYTQQMGGGIGMDFSTIRPRGAIVKRTQSVSSGVLPFMDMWDAMCATIRSSGSRRGAMMATLGIWHPDILEFIEAKQQPGRLTNFNVSVLVPDAFMVAVERDELWNLLFTVKQAYTPGGELEEVEGIGYVYKSCRARELWQRIIETTYVHAEPGVIFIDRINQQNNLQYCEEIHCVNPCFTGDTLVWTAYGPRRFDQLAQEGNTVPVLTQLEDGRLAFRDMTRPRRTRRGARLVEVTLRGSGKFRDSATTVRCTPNHVFFLHGGGECPAGDLVPGQRVASAYRRRANQKGYLRLRGEHESVMEHHVAAEYSRGRRPDYPREHGHHVDEDKTNNHPDNVEILSAPEHNALKMRGARNPVVRFPEKNPFNQPGFAAGRRNGRYRSDIDDAVLLRLRGEGWSRARIAGHLGCCLYTVDKRLREASLNHTVVSVRVLEEREDVYCGTVVDTGRFFVVCGKDEGVLVANCGEQCLPANGDCNLGHTNLAVMVADPFTSEADFRWDTLERSAAIMVRLLDNVLDVTLWPTEEQRAEAVAKRRIGLGFTGLASALQQLGIPYGSPAAVEFTRGVARRQAIAAYTESMKLARERGAFPLFDAEKFCAAPFVQKLPMVLRESIRTIGIRNGVLLSIAPTGTTSLAVGNVSSGIEPVFAHRYKRKVRGGSGEMSNEYSVYDYGYLKYCRHLDISPDGPLAGETMKLPAGFVTADQLTVEQHLQMTAAAQEWVDSAISKTINCPTSMSFEEFREVYTRAHALGLKGCTTYRPDPRSGRGAVLEVPAPTADQEEYLRGIQEASSQYDPDAVIGGLRTKEADHADLSEKDRVAAARSAQPDAMMGTIVEQDDELMTTDGTMKAPPPSDKVPAPARDKVPMQDVAEGRRYRIKWPSEDCAYYVIITDYLDSAGRRRPFELFISTKSERHSEWVKAFSLLVTAIFRREGDPSFLVDELKSVFAATGGTWMPVSWQDKPKLATSLVAAIGFKIEEHMRWLGLIGAELAPAFKDAAALRMEAERMAQLHEPSSLMPASELLDVCDNCGARAVVYQEGCATCGACGRSDCG